jgi:polyhydroxybutyrate depolymerase
MTKWQNHAQNRSFGLAWRLAAMRLLAMFFLVMTAAPAWACGIDSDCPLGERRYRIYIPERKGPEPIGAIVFAHGWRGSAAQILADKSLIALADELHVALVAPQSIGEDWQLPNRPRHRDNTGEVEFRYFQSLVADIVKRFNIDKTRLLATGFSAGGMLVWNLACREGRLFAGFAPIAGTFWAPVPQDCPSPPVHLIHFHGLNDATVPLTGRRIADSKQGEVPNALALFVRAGGFGPEKPMPENGLDCKRRVNPQGHILEFCTHPGGHGYKADYVRRAWRELIAGGRKP